MAFDLNSKEFVERILHQPVKSFVLDDGCKKGDNVAGSLKSIVATTESGETISAVVKTFPPKDSPHRDMIKESGCFRTESDAYQILFKDIEDLVNSLRDPSETDPFLFSVPKIYDSFNDDEDDYICLEDVRPQGYIMPNVFKGLTYPETSLILKELARFHAYSYALIRHHGEQLFADNGKFSRFDFTKQMKMMKQWMGMIAGSTVSSIEIMKGINPSLAKLMQKEIPAEKAWDHMGSFQNLTDAQLFPCFIHGDFWSNNVLIKYENDNEGEGDEKRKPVAVKFLDFQFTRRGNVFEDLVYFIYTSTDTAFRKKYLIRVLQDYYSSFKNAMEVIKVPMPINFTMGSVLDHFSRSAKGALVYMCFAIPFQLGKPSEQSEPQSNDEPKDGNGNEDSNVSASEVSEAPNPDAMLLLGLRQMMENSPPALKRLEEITKEILMPEKY